MEHWIKTIELSALKNNTTASVIVDGKKVLLVYDDGEVYGIENRCSHENYELSEGVVEQGEIMCPEHGSRFSLSTGEPLSLPATQPISTFRVKIENGYIYCHSTAE
jgi:3-phenylpropionate/trans-cinnamate dioxygenase ferredoxin subunit